MGEEGEAVFTPKETGRVILWLGHRIDDINEGLLSRASRVLSREWTQISQLVPPAHRTIVTNQIVAARHALAEHPVDAAAAIAAFREAIRIMSTDGLE